MSDPQSLSDVEPCLCGDPGCAHCGGYLSADIRVIMDGDIDEAIEHAVSVDERTRRTAAARDRIKAIQGRWASWPEYPGETRDERIVRRAESVGFWCLTVGVLLVAFALGIMAFDWGA